MRKLLASLLLALGLVGIPAQVEASPRAKVDCTVYIYQPTTFWQRGVWRPKTMPNGWSTRDWFWYCSGRMRPQKQGPKRPMGPWGVTVHLRLSNCTYDVDESWLRDPNGWRKADIYVSPWPT